MIHTVQNMLKMMRVQSNQDETESFLSTAVEMMYLDNAQDMIAEIILDERPGILANTFDLTLTGTNRYFIPDSIPFNYEQILMVEDYTTSTSPLSTSQTDWWDRMTYYENLDDSVRIPWSVQDQYLEFPNKDNNKTIRVWYTRRPVGLFYGTVGTGNTSTALTFPATPTAGELIPQDDYYNGMKVYFSGQVRTITDYVRSTNVATISPAWTTTPTDSVSTTELLSPLPDRLHKLIPNIGARLVKAGNDDDSTELRIVIKEQLDAIIKRLNKPAIQQPETIRKSGYF